MTKQEAYDKIAKWFSRPKAKFGFDTNQGICVYRGGDNPRSLTRCAVGCLLSNKEYLLIHEADSPIDIGDQLGWSDEVSDFLGKVQFMHDNRANNCDSVASFLADLKVFAEAEGLTV